MRNSLTINTQRIFTNGFLFCLATLPIFSLFWQDSIGILSIKLNWVGYSIFIGTTILTILLRKQIPLPTFYLTVCTVLYLTLAFIRTSDVETPIRLYISLLPFTFLEYFNSNNLLYKWFWILFSVTICVPLYFSYQQYQGTYPYFEFDTIDGESVGRISGGYNKPMNLICFLFPFFLAGLYFIQHKKFLGYLMVCLICSFLWIIGHRTSFIAFLIVLVASFFPTSSNKLIYAYYKYFLNFFVGLVFFVALFIIEKNFGLMDGLRGRIAMWLGHAENFFNSNLINIIFGKQEILLDHDKYSPHLVTRLIGSLEEAHNNTLRTIIYFGIAGYLLYCTLFRWLMMKTYHSTTDTRTRFLKFSCFIFLLLFGITNEPVYYSSLLWATMLGILPIFNKEKATLIPNLK